MFGWSNFREDKKLKKKLKKGKKIGRIGVWLEGKEGRKLVEFGCFSLRTYQNFGCVCFGFKPSQEIIFRKIVCLVAHGK